MNSLRTIDTHTHVLTEETAALLRKEAPKVPVTITPIDKDSATLDVGGVAYRPFPRGGFDVAHRLRDMGAMGVDVQLLSATPRRISSGVLLRTFFRVFFEAVLRALFGVFF